jgi:hypothetical protein
MTVPSALPVEMTAVPVYRAGVCDAHVDDGHRREKKQNTG